jgi:hypothetical protein
MLKIIEGMEMNTSLTNFYMYKGSEVDNDYANYLIDEIFRDEGLSPINIELNKCVAMCN